MQTSGETCREIAKPYPAVIASKARAIHRATKEEMDCFASLAMTMWGSSDGIGRPRRTGYPRMRGV